MKKFFALLFMATLTFSCSSDGEIGPPGPQGPQGPPGEPGLLGNVFDIEGDFTAENDYTLIVPYSKFTDVEVFETDVVLVYLRVGTDGEAEGEPVYVWRQLPQIYYEGEGTVQYNFDYTFFNVNIFLDSNMDLSSLDPVFTQDKVFRIAILPADFAASKKVDISNYKAVMKALNVQDREIPKLKLQK